MRSNSLVAVYTLSIVRASLSRQVLAALLVVSATLALAPTPPAFAAIRPWTGAGPDNNWTTAANWSGNVAPSIGDDLLFPAGVAKQVTINTFASGTTFRSLVFGGSGYNVGGNRFKLTQGIVLSAASGAVTFAQQVEAIADQAFTVTNAGASLVLLAGVSVPFDFLTVNGAGSSELGPLSGLGSLTKQGTGTATLHANSPSFSGPIRVDSGTLRILDAGALGTSDVDTTVSDGGVLEVQLSGSSTIAEPIVLNGAGIAQSGALVNVSGDNTVTNLFLPTGNVGIGVAAGSQLTVSRSIQEGNFTPVGLTKLGPGTLALATQNAFTGPATVSEGILEIRDPLSLGSSGSATTVEAGAALHLRTNGTFTDPSLVDEPLVLNGSGVGGTGALVVVNDSRNTWRGSVTLNGADATLGLTEALGSLELRGPVQGSGGLTKVGSGDLLVNDDQNPVSYAGPTTVRAGTFSMNNRSGTGVIHGPLVIGNDVGGPVATARFLGFNFTPGQIADDAPVTVRPTGLLSLRGSSDTVGSLNLEGGKVEMAANGIVGTLTLAGDLRALPAASAATIDGRFSLGGVTRTFDVADGPAADDLEIAAEIVDGGLTKTGPGTLRLAGANSYGGPTTINAGVLLVDGTQTTSPVTIGGGQLGGIGTVGPIIGSGGVLNPGPVGGPGTLTSGQVRFNSATTFAVDLAGPAASAQDQLVVNGSVDLGDSTLQFALGFTPEVGTAFTLIQNDGTDRVVGTFKGLPEGAFVVQGGLSHRVSYVGGDGNDVTLTRVVLPVLSISDASVSEGNNGPVNAVFTVTLTPAFGSGVTVQFATADGTATAGSDYQGASGTVQFGPGETSKQLVVAVSGDTTVEPNETFTVTLANPVNATLGDAQGVGTIANDDAPTTGSGGEPTPTPTPGPGGPPTATPTPIPPSAPSPGPGGQNPPPSPVPTAQPGPCAPRPDVGVRVAQVGPGTLQVTITAQTNPGTPTNTLRELRLGAASNARLDLPDGRKDSPGNLPLPIPTGTQQVSFTLRRAAPGAFSVPLIAIDTCGEWPTFVGAGVGAP